MHWALLCSIPAQFLVSLLIRQYPRLTKRFGDQEEIVCCRQKFPELDGFLH